MAAAGEGQPYPAPPGTPTSLEDDFQSLACDPMQSAFGGCESTELLVKGQAAKNARVVVHEKLERRPYH